MRRPRRHRRHWDAFCDGRLVNDLDLIARTFSGRTDAGERERRARNILDDTEHFIDIPEELIAECRRELGLPRAELVAFVHVRLAEEESSVPMWVRCLHPREDDFAEPESGKATPFEVGSESGQVVRPELGAFPWYVALQEFAPVFREVLARRATLLRCEEEMLSGIPRLVLSAETAVWEMALRWRDHDGFNEGWKP